MTAIVELKDATVKVNNGFDTEKTILDHVNLTIREGDFITILGGNGAGKSTLFNVIAGTLMLTSGQIFIMGEDVTALPAEKRDKVTPLKNFRRRTGEIKQIAKTIALKSLRSTLKKMV